MTQQQLEAQMIDLAAELYLFEEDAIEEDVYNSVQDVENDLRLIGETKLEDGDYEAVLVAIWRCFTDKAEASRQICLKIWRQIQSWKYLHAAERVTPEPWDVMQIESGGEWLDLWAIHEGEEDGNAFIMKGRLPAGFEPGGHIRLIRRGGVIWEGVLGGPPQED
jgi:hypothetical protein